MHADICSLSIPARYAIVSCAAGMQLLVVTAFLC